MEFSRSMQKVMERAVGLARKEGHRYFMPEHMLYGATFDEDLSEAFEEGGGDIEKLRADLLRFVKEQAGNVGEGSGARLTADTEQVLKMAESQAHVSSRSQVDVNHLLAAILHLEDSFAVYYLAVQGVDTVELLGELSRASIARERAESREGAGQRTAEGDQGSAERTGGPARKGGSAAGDSRGGASAGWQETGDGSEAGDRYEDEADAEEDQARGKRWKSYLEDMNVTCMDKNPLIGREEELERTIQILCRKDKNNVLHIGEPGVGKTALAYGLARQIVEERVPEPLLGARVYALDLGGLLAGTQYRGDFEKRFKKIMDGLAKEEKPILYVDEIHNIVGAGAVNGGSLDAANLLKPYLAAGHIRFIGATTYEGYKKHFSGSRSLVRRFGNVKIKEPTKEEAVKILKGLQEGYEHFHQVSYGPGVLEYAVDLSSRFVNERYLPDKAIDLIDEAGAYRHLHPLKQRSQKVDKRLIEKVLSQTCGIPLQTVEKDDVEKLALLEGQLKARIFGQERAVEQVCNAVKFSRAGLNDEDKPIASFLFVGATGVGKTELAKVLAAELGIAFIRFDMSEYAEKHAVAKLIGAPAGYVGYEEGGLLTEKIRRSPHGVLLLDEIEKAHPDIYNVLLQAMDYGTLTDNQGRQADLRNIILIMTSNAGARQAGKSRIGFGSGAADMDALAEAVDKTFQPEFRNRLSRIVFYNAMDEAMAERITEKKLAELVAKLAGRKVTLTISPEAKAHVCRAGITQEYGAREIDRVIAGEVKPLLVELLLFGRLKKGGSCRLEVQDGKLVLL